MISLINRFHLLVIFKVKILKIKKYSEKFFVLLLGKYILMHLNYLIYSTV